MAAVCVLPELGLAHPHTLAELIHKEQPQLAEPCAYFSLQ
jgi:hypothetical protein